MDAIEARRLALELAVSVVRQGVHDDAVHLARQYNDFLCGTRDAEIIDAARALAAKISQP